MVNWMANARKGPTVRRPRNHNAGSAKTSDIKNNVNPILANLVYKSRTGSSRQSWSWTLDTAVCFGGGFACVSTYLGSATLAWQLGQYPLLFGMTRRLQFLQTIISIECCPRSDPLYCFSRLTAVSAKMRLSSSDWEVLSILFFLFVQQSSWFSLPRPLCHLSHPPLCVAFRHERLVYGDRILSDCR